MATDVYYESTPIGHVSTSGEVYYGSRKVGWVNGDGDIYYEGIYVGWISRSGAVLDPRANRIGRVDRSGTVYKGTAAVGRVDSPANRYHTAGAALLLLLGKHLPLPPEAADVQRDPSPFSPPPSSVAG